MTTERSNVFPCLRYRDGAAAIDWLGRAFGFAKHAAYEGPNGTIAHAELSLGAGMVMLGEAQADQFGWKSPRELGGAVTQSVYFCVPDIEAHYARAKAAGAEIVRELQDTSYGSREYSARDPEGHLWHFGTYMPEPPKG